MKAKRFVNFCCLLFLSLILFSSCSTTRESYENENEKTKKLCLSNPMINAESIKIVKNKKYLKNCKYLKKVKVDYCYANEDVMRVYHLSLLQSEAIKNKVDTLYYNSLTKADQNNKITGYLFKCTKKP